MHFDPERLRAAREAADWSREQLARVVDIHPVTVHKYERGLVAPSARLLGLLASALRVPVSEFYVDDHRLSGADLARLREMVDALPPLTIDDLDAVDAILTPVVEQRPRTPSGGLATI